MRNYKIFCVGVAKTGTTSLGKALRDLGYIMGNQTAGELLAKDWANKRIDRIVRLCRTAEAFKDVPFYLPGLYKELDKVFPNSKFILTVRDDENQWYDSVKRFYTKILAKDKSKLPTLDDIRNAKYRYKGWMFDMAKLFLGYPNIRFFDEQRCKRLYLEHIKDVENHFRKRKQDLLILNVAKPGSYQRLTRFLGLSIDKNAVFPWENKT